MFYQKTIQALIAAKDISTTDSVLVVCGGPYDVETLNACGFKTVTISNLDTDYQDFIKPFQWDRQDAENLTYANGTFDVVLVHAGLHHCYSPHRAMLEMYRVARKAIIVFEARDSLLMSVSKVLGMQVDYEVEGMSEANPVDGVSHTEVPNFVYRWKEREVVKAVASFDPARVPRVKFFYGMALPFDRFRRTRNRIGLALLTVAAPFMYVLEKVAPSQCNSFAWVIRKDGAAQPWLTMEDGKARMNFAWAKSKGRYTYGGKYMGKGVPRSE